MSDPLAPLASAVVAVLRPHLSDLVARVETLQAQAGTPAPLLDRNGCARLLGCSLRTLDTLRAAGLPELRLIDAPRFEAGAVLAWLRSRPREAA